MKPSLFLLGFMPLLLACQPQGPTRVEEDFGLSVRQMVEEQKYLPGDEVRTGQQPLQQNPQPLDGAEAVRTIDRYKKTKDSAAAKSKAAKRNAN